MFWNCQNRWVLTKILHAEFPFNFFDKMISKSNRPPRWHLDCGSDSFKLIYNVRIEAISSYPKRKHFQHYWACPTTSRWLLRLTTSYGPLINLGVFSRLNQISSSHCFVLLSFSLICRKENRMLLPFPSPINSENDNMEKSINDLILVLTIAIWREKNSAANS